MADNTNVIEGQQLLLHDLRCIINDARMRVASTANSELTLMYWHIGERINRELLHYQRAEYGKQIVSTLSTQLQEEYGSRGFELRSIRRMMQFALKFPDEQIELLQLDKAGIKVANYMTELPPKEILIKQIRKSLEIAKTRILSEDDSTEK